MKDNKAKIDPAKCDALVAEIKVTGGMSEEVKSGLVQCLSTLSSTIKAIDKDTCDEAVVVKACQTIGSLIQ